MFTQTIPILEDDARISDDALSKDEEELLANGTPCSLWIENILLRLEHKRPLTHALLAALKHTDKHELQQAFHSVFERNNKANKAELLNRLLFCEQQAKWSKVEKHKLFQLKRALIASQLLEEEAYLSILTKIQNLHTNYKLKPYEKILRTVLAGYSGIGFAGGISAVILLFTPAGILFEVSIRSIVALISLILEYKNKTGESADHDNDLHEKVTNLSQTLTNNAQEESELRLSSYATLEKIHELNHERDQLLTSATPTKAPTLTFPTCKEQFDRRLKGCNQDPAIVEIAHQTLVSGQLDKSREALSHPSYSPTIRTFLGGTLTVFGTAASILTLAGVAAIPVLGIPLLGFVLVGAALLNVGISTWFHKMNQRSAKRNVEFKSIYKDIYEESIARLEQVKTLRTELKNEKNELKATIAELKNKNLTRVNHNLQANIVQAENRFALFAQSHASSTPSPEPESPEPEPSYCAIM